MLSLHDAVDTGDWVIVGKFGRPHGIKGFITVIPFTEPPDNIIAYRPWYIQEQQHWCLLNITEVKINHHLILARPEGYKTRDQAVSLTHTAIAVPSKQLPFLEAGEYYWHQLIGMQVFNTKGLLLGSVTEMLPTGTHDVLIVCGQKRYLIPYLPGNTIVSVDETTQIITVDWSEDF